MNENEKPLSYWDSELEFLIFADRLDTRKHQEVNQIRYHADIVISQVDRKCNDNKRFDHFRPE